MMNTSPQTTNVCVKQQQQQKHKSERKTNKQNAGPPTSRKGYRVVAQTLHRPRKSSVLWPGKQTKPHQRSASTKGSKISLYSLVLIVFVTLPCHSNHHNTFGCLLFFQYLREFNYSTNHTHTNERTHTSPSYII